MLISTISHHIPSIPLLRKRVLSFVHICSSRFSSFRSHTIPVFPKQITTLQSRSLPLVVVLLLPQLQPVATTVLSSPCICTCVLHGPIFLFLLLSICLDDDVFCFMCVYTPPSLHTFFCLPPLLRSPSKFSAHLLSCFRAWLVSTVWYFLVNGQFWFVSFYFLSFPSCPLSSLIPSALELFTPQIPNLCVC